MKYRVGSMFAGVGGICLGFQNAKTNKSKYELEWANEIDKYSCATYRLNFSHKLYEGDIEKILHPELVDKEKNGEEYKKYKIMNKELLSMPVDILTGGFPCQAFSIAGEQNGFKDPRGNLFLSIIDYINQIGKKHFKPRILFLENVKNLKNHDKGRTYKIIKSKLSDAGYTIVEKVLNTMEYSDLPQNRERIYIIGFLNESDAKKFNGFDENYLREHRKTKTKKQRENDIKKVINYKLTSEDISKYYYTKEKYPKYFMTKKEFNRNKDNKHEWINLTRQITEKYQFYQVRRGMYVRQNQSNVCPTLTANMGTGGHNVPLIKVDDGIRKITPCEAFKLQGFPIDAGYELPKTINGRPYGDANLYKQAGNAVSVPIIQMLAEELLRVLESEKS